MRSDLSFWLNAIAKFGFRRQRKGSSNHHSKYRRRLRVESLESRQLLAVTVNTLVDERDGSVVDGDASLRDAIAVAPSSDGIINFAQSLFASGPRTMTLTYDGPDAGSTPDPLAINANVTINGPGAELLTISGGQQTNVLSINGATVRITDLKLTQGWVAEGEAGIDANAASLTLERMIISSNVTVDTGTAAPRQILVR
jgi:hypothetical protein